MDIQYHTELTELTDIISLDANLFCDFCGICVTFTHLASRLFLPHTHTERTEFIIFALTLSVRSVPSV